MTAAKLRAVLQALAVLAMPGAAERSRRPSARPRDLRALRVGAVMRSRLLRPRAALAAGVLLVLAGAAAARRARAGAAAVGLTGHGPAGPAAARACPPGTTSNAQRASMHAREV